MAESNDTSANQLLNTEDENRLMDAIRKVDLETVQFLLFEKNVSPNFVMGGHSPICKAVTKGSESLLDLLIAANSDLNTVHTIDTMWQRRPIHLAASKGHVHILKKLLENGVDVNSRDSDQRTALHWSATYGREKVAEYLISQGALVNLAQSDGFTALHAATCLGHSNVCRVLLKNGAEVSQSDRDGWNSLHTAVCYGHILVVKTLVEHLSSLSRGAITSDGDTYLHVAASSGHTAIAMLLVDHGCDLNVKNNAGYTPFHLAMHHSRFKICKYLAEIGANIQTHNESGQSPLYLASLRSDNAFVQLLIHSGYNFSKESWIHDNRLPVILQKNPKLSQILFQYARNPRSLKDLCIFRVRKELGKNILRTVHELHIPKSLKDNIIFNFQKLDLF